MKYLATTLAASLAAVAINLSGCDSASTTPPPATSENQGEHPHDDHAGHAPEDMAKVEAVLAKLSPEDAESAAKQRICPVSGELLGTMGVPKKGRREWPASLDLLRRLPRSSAGEPRRVPGEVERGIILSAMNSNYRSSKSAN